MMITEKQKRDIEQLIPEHEDALAAFGVDIYQRGMITGAVGLTIGVCCGFIVERIMVIYKHRKSKKNKDES